MKRYSKSLGKYKSKLQRDTTSHLLEWQQLKKKTSVSKDMEKLEHLCIDGNIKWYSVYGKWYGSS